MVQKCSISCSLMDFPLQYMQNSCDNSGLAEKSDLSVPY